MLILMPMLVLTLLLLLSSMTLMLKSVVVGVAFVLDVGVDVDAVVVGGCCCRC